MTVDNCSHEWNEYGWCDKCSAVRTPEQLPSNPLLAEMRSLEDKWRREGALVWCSLIGEAADEIERLRAALENIVATESVDDDGEPVPETGACFLARKALRGADETTSLPGTALPGVGETEAGHLLNKALCLHFRFSEYEGVRRCHVCNQKWNIATGEPL